MTDASLQSSRPIRVLVASVTAAIVGLGAATSAGAAGGGSAPGAPAAIGGTESALQIQAQELAGQIQADGRNLDRLAESVDAAQLRRQGLAGQLQSLEASMAATDARATAAKTALKEQALLSYLAGGGPLISDLPSRPGSDPSLTVSYAEIVAGGQRRAISAYRTVMADQARQSKQLASADRQAAASLAILRADQSAAAGAFAARQLALAQVKGRLATLVAQVQAAQQQAQQAVILASLSRQGQAPPATPPETAAPAPVPTTGPVISPAPPTTRSSLRTTSTVVASTTTPPTPTTSPTTAPPPTTVPPPPPGNHPARGSGTAVRYAYAQLGKPYQWGGAGPSSFDCSGLTMMAWAAAGVYFPHLAQDQFDLTRRIPLSDVQPGDLIFFGTPDDVYHVGISIGGGEMIDAPETGQSVSISTIYWADLLGAGRIID